MKKRSQKRKKIFVGVSGGVDSSVALALLKEQGHEVTGVFIRTWQPDWIACTWGEERRDVMRVCAHLQVPFVELDLEEEYKKGVADYMVAEYRLGRTPNPDVMCNREVKFGGFLRWAQEKGADFVATGHYARIEFSEGNSTRTLLRGRDKSKDQSYFLWTLEQNQLQHILFPVGNLLKSELRIIAKRYQLPTAQKKDSQGICFIGEIDMKDFLHHYIDQQPGKVLNVHGESIGHHEGSLFYTIGERRGFSIDKEHKGSDDRPYYVIVKNKDNNTITISQDPRNDTSPKTDFKVVDVVDNTESLSRGMTVQAQIRYRGEIKSVHIKDLDHNKKTARIDFDKPDPSIAAGQSVVFYQGDRCLGGGIIA